MKRPLAWVALFYGGGVLLAEFYQPPLPLLILISLVLAASGICWAGGRRIILGPLLICAGWTNLSWHTAIISPDDLRHLAGDSPEIVSVRGTLIETPSPRIFVRQSQESWRTQARMKLAGVCQEGTWRPASGELAVTVAGLLPDHFFAQQSVEITGVLAPPPLPLADGLFDFRTHLRRQGIYFQLKTESSNDWLVLAPAKISRPLADRFRGWARRSLALGLPGEDDSLRLEQTLTLGDKTVWTEELAEPFVRAATYHIFAVDGLRMAIIFGICFSLFRVAGLPRAAGGLLLLPVIWFYTALTGWPASAIRATVMLSVIIFGWVLKRPSDLLNSLCAAALIILVWEPQQLFQPGFQLSFLVVLCIILMMPAFEKFKQRLLRPDPLLPETLRPRWRKVWDWSARHLLDLLFVSLAAWLGSIPLVALYFHIFTPVSGPANVVAVPLCALVLVSNFISLLLAGWLPMGAEIFNHAGCFLMECIRLTSVWFAGWPAAYYYVAAPGLFSTALYYAILLAGFTGWLFKPCGRPWKMGGLFLLTTFWLVQWHRENSITRLTILPLSGGSAVYCDAPGRSNDLLVDCGSSNSVTGVMKPFLRAQGVNQLADVALTHGDVRHVGGVKLLDELFPVGQIVTGSGRFRSTACRAALEDFTNRHREVHPGDQFKGWTVLHPRADDHFAEADDCSLVLSGEFSRTRVLLLSDLGRAGQTALRERSPDLRAEIVIACLPENGEPLDDALLDALQPKLIIIADAEFPASKRASRRLHERLELRGVPVIYTRASGAATISLAKDHWSIRTAAGRPAFSPR